MPIRENLKQVRDVIERACDTANRDPAAVCLIAVTKTVEIERIQQAYDLGLRHFGESRLQESDAKISALPSDIVWHLIGRLQSNKARRASRMFSVIHTLESESQLDELSKSDRPSPIDALIEVNIAQEQQKSGVLPGGLDRFVEMVLRSKNVRLRGLMTVGPLCGEPEAVRPYFAQMRELKERVPNADWLSMGMSGDFDVAIQEGSTHIRVGTAIFGERD